MMEAALAVLAVPEASSVWFAELFENCLEQNGLPDVEGWILERQAVPDQAETGLLHQAGHLAAVAL